VTGSRQPTEALNEARKKACKSNRALLLELKVSYWFSLGVATVSGAPGEK
jgi:hypothetical protein